MKIVLKLLKSFGLLDLLSIKRTNYKIKYFNTSMSHLCYHNPLGYRIDEEVFFRTYLRAGDTVIDVGANIGLLTLTAAYSVGRNGRVYTFEALPEMYKYLISNIKLNDFSNVAPYNYGVGNFDGEVLFSSDHEDDTTNEVASEGNIKVKMVTLDTLLDNNVKSIHLLKIDVEGYEKFVLQGARRMLSKTQCIFFEVYEPNFNKYHYSTSDLFEILVNAGFEIHEITKEGLRKIQDSYQPEECKDLIAVNLHYYKEFAERLRDSVYKFL